MSFLAAKCKGIPLDIVKWHRRQEENSVQRERSEREFFFEVYLRERSEQKNFKVPSCHHAIMPSGGKSPGDGERKPCPTPRGMMEKKIKNAQKRGTMA